MYHNMFGGGMWFTWLFWIIIIAVIAWLVITMVNRSQKNQGSGSAKESPFDILKNKYAKGEINKEEYLEKKKDLS
ncbi:MAG: SHOCT domain-containing protein [Ignavibacteriaceae bacterium]